MCDFMYVGVVGCIRACVDSLIVESEVSQVIYFPPAKAQWVFGVALDATEHTDVGKQLRDGLLVSMGTAEGFPVDAFLSLDHLLAQRVATRPQLTSWWFRVLGSIRP